MFELGCKKIIFSKISLNQWMSIYLIQQQYFYGNLFQFLNNSSLIMISDKFRLYAIMVLMNFLAGWYDTSFGAIIPYFSNATGIDETDYSFLFMVKTSANIISGFIIKYLIKRVSTEKLAIGYLLLVTLSLCASTFSLSNINLGVTLFIATGAFVGVSVIAFSVTIKLFLQDSPEYYVQYHQFFFAIGALTGQFSVIFAEEKSFLVLGLAHVIPMAAVMLYQLPDLSDLSNPSSNKGVTLGTKSKVLICLIFFFFATVELGISSWIPTYAIKAGVSDVKGSTIFSLLFWVPNCLTRPFWIYLPGTVNDKLGYCLKGVFLAAAITLVLQVLQLFKMVCFFSSISIGMLISGVFGFGLSLVVKNGFKFCPDNNAMFVLSNALGEGLLIMPMGFTMGLLGYKSMIIEIAFFAAFALIAFMLAMSSMEDDKNEYKVLYEEEENRQNHDNTEQIAQRAEIT